jgi:flagellar operon protein (TIGR03826 family)
MNLKNCPECGKVYVENPAGLCPECYQQEEEASVKVAEYLRDHPKSHIDDIHQATGVKHKVILKMIRKGRIFGDVSIAYPCETCGKAITEGRICNECSNNILSQLKKSDLPKEEPMKRDIKQEKRSGMFTNRFKP